MKKPQQLPGTVRGSVFARGHQAFTRSILGDTDVTVESKGSQFYNANDFPVLYWSHSFVEYVKEQEPQTVDRQIVAEIARDAKSKIKRVNKIVIASTPQWVDKQYMDLLDGGIVHEALHSLFTQRGREIDVDRLTQIMGDHYDLDVNYPVRQQVFKSLHNIFEDAYIERYGIEEFRGALRKLQTVHQFVWDKEKYARQYPALGAPMVDENGEPLKDDEGEPLVDPWGNPLRSMSAMDHLTCYLRDRCEHYLAAAPLDEYHPQVRQIVDLYFADIIADSDKTHSTYDTFELAMRAIKIVADLFEIHEMQMQMPQDGPPQQGQGGGGEEGEEGGESGQQQQQQSSGDSGDSSGEAGEEQQSAGGGDSNDEDDSEAGDSDDESDSDGSGGESDDESEEGSEDSEGGGSDGGDDESEEDSEGSGGSGEDSEEDSEEDSDGDNSSDAGNPNRDKGREEETEEEGTPSDPKDPKNPEQIDPKDIDEDVLKSLQDPNANNDNMLDNQKVLKQEWDKQVNTDAPPSVLPFTVEYDTVVKLQPANTDYEMDVYNNMMEKVKNDTLYIRPRMLSFFRGQKKSRLRHRREKGRRLSSRSISEVIYKERPRPFQTKEQTDRRNSVVSLVLDESGSMSSAVAQARQILMTLALTIGELRIPMEIIGFTTNGRDSIREYCSESGEDYNSVWHDANGKFSRSCATQYRIFREFDEPFNVNSYRKMTQTKAGNMTPLPDAVEFAAKRLVTRKEEQKIMFVVTDGQPYYSPGISWSSEDYLNMMRTQVEEMRQANMEVLFVGIQGATYVERYPNSLVISDMNNFANEMAAFIFEQMKRLLVE